MAFTTLRTLTLKSTLAYGKYPKDTVKQVLALHKGSYLVWSYYNLTAISFNDEVLTLLGIDHKISKPGIDKEYFKINGKRLATVLMKPSEGANQERINRAFERKIKKAGIGQREYFYSNKKRNQEYSHHGCSPMTKLFGSPNSPLN